jgi:glycosyltransferase involved in cell wall biosynthesis
MFNSISVIIPSYNSSKSITYTLDSLLSQSNAELLQEIIIVDSSDDGFLEGIFKKYEVYENIRIIKSKKKLIPATARNLGANEARGKLLAFVDSDVFLAHDWAEKILEGYKKGCLIGAGSISLPNFQNQKLIPLAQFFFQLNEFIESGKERNKFFVPACNLFCERELFQKAGGFPDIRAAEDVLFGIKINKIKTPRFIPDIKAYHIFREDLAGFLKNQILLGKYVILYHRLSEKNKFYYQEFWPILFLLPFLIIKLFRITRRVFKTRPSTILKYLWSFPVFLLGFLFWSIGFIKGIAAKDEQEG